MDIISDKVVTTRKDHRCSACDRKFPKGTKMRTQVNTYDGIQTWRECPTCHVLLSEFRDRFDDEYGWVPGSCVSEVCEIGQTPEELLTELKR